VDFFRFRFRNNNIFIVFIENNLHRNMKEKKILIFSFLLSMCCDRLMKGKLLIYCAHDEKTKKPQYTNTNKVFDSRTKDNKYN
jgi:hypothetical protein